MSDHRTLPHDAEVGHAFAALSEKQRRALIALCTHPTIIAAATAAGVQQSTIHQWLKLDEFKGALAQYQNAILSHQIRHLEGAVEQAVGVLRDMMRNASRDDTKVRAAQIVLDTVLRARKLDLATRLDGVEKRQAELEVDWRELQNSTAEEVERMVLAVQSRERE